MQQKDEEELFRRVEAEQALILNIIEDSKKLAARSEALLNSARARRSRQAEGEPEDA